jgi:uncharacterized protein YtpQ (UPF0354 family)
MTVTLTNPFHKATIKGEDYYLVKSNTEYTLNVVNNISMNLDECSTL